MHGTRSEVTGLLWFGPGDGGLNNGGASMALMHLGVKVDRNRRWIR